MKIKPSRRLLSLGAILGIQIIGALLGFLLQLVIARNITVSDYGKFSITINTLVILSMMINFGSVNSVLRSVSISTSENRAAILKSYVSFNVMNWLFLSFMMIFVFIYASYREYLDFS